MPHYRQSRLTHDGVELQVYHWRPDPIRDKLLLLSHGLGEHALRYDHVAEYFAGRGYDVVAFDHQGHGASGGERGCIVSIESIVGETATVLSATDAPQYRHRVLWGQSMGGLLALAALREASFAERLSAAIVTSPALALGTAPNIALRAISKGLAHLLPRLTIDNGLDAADLSHDPTVGERYLADPRNHSRVSLLLGRLFLSLPETLLEAPTAPAHTPLLLMQGSEDAICDVSGARDYAALNAAAPVTYREWPRLWHELHHEPNWGEVLSAAADFLDGQLR